MDILEGGDKCVYCGTELVKDKRYWILDKEKSKRGRMTFGCIYAHGLKNNVFVAYCSKECSVADKI